MPEEAEVCLEIQRETVGRDPPAQMHSDRRYFGAVYPNSRHSRTPLRLDPELVRRSDQRFLQCPNVPDYILADQAEVENQIAHQLPWPVESNVPASVALDHFDPEVSKHNRGREHVLFPSVSAQSNHWRVLEEQHGVTDKARLTLFNEPALLVPGLPIRHQSEAANRAAPALIVRLSWSLTRGKGPSCRPPFKPLLKALVKALLKLKH